MWQQAALGPTMATAKRKQKRRDDFTGKVLSKSPSVDLKAVDHCGGCLSTATGRSRTMAGPTAHLRSSQYTCREVGQTTYTGGGTISSGDRRRTRPCRAPGPDLGNGMPLVTRMTASHTKSPGRCSEMESRHLVMPSGHLQRVRHLVPHKQS